jgi:predicted ATP-dependent endonuclease of OLD family
MKLTNVKVKNFRLLHNVELTFNHATTAIVGKNNSGKTSLTTIFDIFLNSSKLDFSDFSLESHKSFIQAYEIYRSKTEENEEQTLKEIQNTFPKIQLYLTIKYDENDNWALIKPFLTN